MARFLHPVYFGGIGDALKGRRIISVGNVTSDEVLTKLSRLDELRELQIAGDVTDNGLTNLRGITSLKVLRIRSDRVTAGGLAELSVPYLEVLELHGSKITDECLRWANGLTQLRVLDISGPGITDAGMQHITELREIRRLSLQNTLVTNDGLSKLKKLNQLESVELSGAKTTMGGLAHLMMDLQGRPFGEWFPAKVIREVDRGRVYVSMSGEQFQDDFLPYLLNAVPDATELELIETKVSSKGISALSGLATLKHLALRNMSVAVVADVPSLQRLSLISLGGNPLPELRNMPQLQAIAFAGAQWNLASREDDQPYAGNNFRQLIEFGKTTPSLNTLIFEGSEIDDKQVALLSSMNIVELNLGGTKITDESLKRVGKMPTVMTLRLRDTSVTNGGVVELGVARLKSLDLGSNTQITDAIIPTLVKMKSLEQLGIVNTGITTSGAAKLRKLLPNCDIIF